MWGCIISPNKTIEDSLPEVKSDASNTAYMLAAIFKLDLNAAIMSPAAIPNGPRIDRNNSVRVYRVSQQLST